LITLYDEEIRTPNIEGRMSLLPGTFMSRKSKKSVLEKFREPNIHKWRKPIGVIAKELRPVIQGIINSYCKFSSRQTSDIWLKLNASLLKWVKCEKELYKKASFIWLQKKFKESPLLFPHRQLANP